MINRMYYSYVIVDADGSVLDVMATSVSYKDNSVILYDNDDIINIVNNFRSLKRVNLSRFHKERCATHCSVDAIKN